MTFFVDLEVCFLDESNISFFYSGQTRCRWDLPSIPFRTKLIAAYRNNTNVDNYFKEQQSEIEQDKKQIECIWMQLQIDQDNLRNNLIRFNQVNYTARLSDLNVCTSTVIES